MSVPFTFHVPSDRRYRILAPEVAGKYAELAGGTPADGVVLAAALSAAMDDLSNGADADFELSYRIRSGEVEVTVQCAGRSTVVKHPLTVPNL